MIPNLSMYSTEALIKELEKRDYSCIEAELLNDIILNAIDHDAYIEVKLEDL